MGVEISPLRIWGQLWGCLEQPMGCIGNMMGTFSAFPRCPESYPAYPIQAWIDSIHMRGVLAFRAEVVFLALLPLSSWLEVKETLGSRQWKAPVQDRLRVFHLGVSTIFTLGRTISHFAGQHGSLACRQTPVNTLRSRWQATNAATQLHLPSWGVSSSWVVLDSPKELNLVFWILKS